jgi:hypothetical protein
MKAMRTILPIFAVALVIATVCSIASAQATPITIIPAPGGSDVFTTNYFSNNTAAGAPHATLRVTNDGSGASQVVVGALLAIQPVANDGLSEDGLCANVYVFDDSQEFKECCSCPISPNGMRTWDIHTDLNSNPANGIVANQGLIQVVSTHATGTGGGCDPTGGFNVFFGTGAGLTLEPEVEAWATHVQLANLPNSKSKPPVVAAYSLTETEAIEEELSGHELTTLELECAFATASSGFGQGSGSGAGVCGCGFEL